MKIVGSWSMKLLAVYLILIGLTALVPILHPIVPVLPFLAITTGVFIIIGK